MELPNGFRIVDGVYEVQKKNNWCVRTNFTMKLTGEVKTTGDSLYIAVVTRDDGVSGVGYFALRDVYKPKDLATALNRSTQDGGVVCFFSNSELSLLVSFLIKKLKEDSITYRKELIYNAGVQPNTSVMAINRTQYIDLNLVKLRPLEDSSFVWLSRYSPRPEFERHFPFETDVSTLADFLDLASDILGQTFGVAMMAWSSMYSLNAYPWIISNLRHFNLPVLFGDPMVGKSLIASCGAWLNGCPKNAIASRCTLSYVTAMVTTTTMPFIWDDPSSPDDVAQLAIDLGNAAVRGKSTETPKVPSTGCLVTANFQMTDMLKHFSRMLLLKVEKTKEKKRAGAAKELEDAAAKASAAFPCIVAALYKMQANEVISQTKEMEETLDADLRIVEGISLQLVVLKKILRMCNREKYFIQVEEYIEEKLLPFYKNVLANMEANNDNIPGVFLNVKEVNGVTCTFIKQGKILAVSDEVIQSKKCAKGAGCLMNRTTRINGKPVKRHHIPTELLTPAELEEIEILLFENNENNIEEEQEAITRRENHEQEAHQGERTEAEQAYSGETDQEDEEGERNERRMSQEEGNSVGTDGEDKQGERTEIEMLEGQGDSGEKEPGDQQGERTDRRMSDEQGKNGRKDQEEERGERTEIEMVEGQEDSGEKEPGDQQGERRMADEKGNSEGIERECQQGKSELERMQRKKRDVRLQEEEREKNCCVCKKKDGRKRVWVECSSCKMSYHGTCKKISRRDCKKIEEGAMEWMCGCTSL